MIITLKGANFASSNIGTLDSWLISKSLTGVTIDNTATSVKKGEAYKAVITLKENYTFPDTITVTMGGTDITSTYVTKTATTITINIPSVTGNIVIRVNATSVGASTDQYKITYNLKGVHMYNTTTAVDKNSTYLSAIDILTNSALSSSPAVSYTVTMGGTTLTQGTDYTIGSTDVTNTKLLTINEVTGDVNIKIESLYSTTGSTALDAGKWPNPRQSVGSAIQYYPTITSDSSKLICMTIPSNVHVYTYMNNVRITGTSEYSSIVLTDANDKVLEYYTFNNSSRGHDFKSYSTETKLYYHSSMITISYFWAANTNTLASYTIKANPSAATINVNKLSGMSAPCARCNGNLTVSAAVGTAITYGVGLEGYTAQSETITLTQSGTTSKVVTLVKEETGGGEEPVTLTLHKSATGNSILDYQNVWKMFGASSLANLGSQIIGVDVSAYAGQTISITAAQSVISGANYAMFCSNLPNAYIKTLEQLDGYNSFGTATSYEAESYDNLIESFNISTVKETTNTLAKVVPTNAKYLFFSNLSTICAEPSVVTGQATGASLPTYVTDYGWGAMDYQTYFYLTGNNTYKSYNSKVVAADVSQLVGQTLSITATQNIVDGASFSFFTNALPSDISTLSDISGLDYSNTVKYNFNDSDLVEGFNVSTTHQVQNTIEKVVPAGAKYLFVTTLDKFGSCDIKLV